MKNPQIQFFSSSEGWNISSYNEIGENFKYGLSVPAIPFDGENKYLRITDIDDDTRIFDKTNLSSPGIDLSLANEYILTEGDITFARTGASVGKSYLYDAKDGKIYFAGFLIKIGIKKNVCASFIFQNSLTNNFKRYINLVSQRSGQPGINIKELQAYKLYIPKTLEEQQKIASYFQSLDSLIQVTSKKLASLKQIKTASLQSMFPQEGETVPKVRFKGFEGEWEEKSFSALYKKSIIKNDLTFGTDKIISVANMYYLTNVNVSDLEYLKTYNIMKLGDIAFEGNKSKRFLHGRFVENTIGDGIVSHVFVVFHPISAEHDINYWKYAINNENIMRNVLIRCTKSSTMMTDLVVDDFLKETILVPSYAEQQKIGAYFRNLDQQISLQTQRLEKLKQIKVACLDKMFV